MIKSILKSSYSTYIYTAFLIILSLIPGQTLTQAGIYGLLLPIVIHFIEFIILGSLTIINFSNPWKTLLYCLTIAIVTEIIQYFVPGRLFDSFDISINLIGSLVGMSAGSLLNFCGKDRI